jgi:hypothetical protein
MVLITQQITLCSIIYFVFVPFRTPVNSFFWNRTCFLPAVASRFPADSLFVFFVWPKLCKEENERFQFCSVVFRPVCLRWYLPLQVNSFRHSCLSDFLNSLFSCNRTILITVIANSISVDPLFTCANGFSAFRTIDRITFLNLPLQAPSFRYFALFRLIRNSLFSWNRTCFLSAVASRFPADSLFA